MDFLDPKKQRAHLIRLFIGYILVGTALILTTIILLYQAYGFGIKNGEVIQNGLVFVSSRPRPADIYVNNAKRDETTNSRLLLPAGPYTFKLQREGYRTWQRAITVEGGSVARFDYPMLFPTKLTTNTLKTYDANPGIATQSPNHRWALVQGSEGFNVFDLYDLDNVEKASVPLTVPANMLIEQGTHSWELVDWANDNKHVLLRHISDMGGVKTSEYVLINREDATESVNITAKLGTNPTKIELRGDKYDKYYAYDQSAATLSTASLEEPVPKQILEHVLSFKSHDDDVVLYTTDEDAPEGKSVVKLKDGNETFTIRQVSAASDHLLDIARYSGDWYIVAGARSDNRMYVYKNPASSLDKNPQAPVVPVQVLKVTAPTYVSFSDNARFVMAESGPQFAVYDAETDKGYAYTQQAPLDAPQGHATWMDGHSLMYVSNGKVFVFEFDNANKELLNAADPNHLPFFDPKYTKLYSFAGQTGPANYALNSTDLLLPKDQ